MSPSSVSPPRSNHYALLASLPHNYGLDSRTEHQHQQTPKAGEDFVHIPKPDESFVRVKTPKHLSQHSLGHSQTENPTSLNQAKDSFTQTKTAKNKSKKQQKKESWTLLDAPSAKPEAKPSSWLKRWVPGF